MRRFIGFLPGSNRAPLAPRPFTDPRDRDEPSLDTLIPANPNKPYDMKELIEKVVDDGDFFELQPNYAGNIVIGFARMEGATVGIVANQPMVLAGCLDIDSATQGGAVRPVLRLLQRSPSSPSSTCRGSCPAPRRNSAAIIKHGAKLLFAFAEATVPKVTLITRKAYGGAYDVMSSKHLRGDVNFAWPSAEIAVMGPKGAVEIIFRGDLRRPGDDRRAHRGIPREIRQPVRRRQPRLYRRRDPAARPPAAASARALAMLRNKQLANPWKKHDNIPL